MNIAEQVFNVFVAGGGVLIMFAFIAYFLEHFTRNE